MSRANDASIEASRPFVAVHLGAGNHARHRRRELVALAKSTASRGIELLNGGTDCRAVAAELTKLLESSPLTNAGYGSQLNVDGAVECDASMVHSSGVGTAVGAVSGVLHPVEVAYRMSVAITDEPRDERGLVKPLFLCGNGARQYAAVLGCEVVEPQSMVSPKAKRSYDRAVAIVGPHQGGAELHDDDDDDDDDENGIEDTVGVICCDMDGSIAAASSSGGAVLKPPGRIGPAGVVGAGTNIVRAGADTAACCCTGRGEDIMALAMASQIASDIAHDGDLQETFARFASSQCLQSSPLYAGCLAVLADEHSCYLQMAHTCHSMLAAYATPSSAGILQSWDNRPGTLHTCGISL